MGSSKKHKEKDREGKKKKKKRSRSRSKSRSHEKSKRRERSRSKDRSHRKESRKHRSDRDEDHSLPAKMVKREKSDSFADPPPPSTEAVSGGGSSSLSIAETNKLRAKLGLKPLNTDSTEATGEKESLKDDVHRPAENLGEKRRTKEIEEKLLAIRRKRELKVQLGRVRTLGTVSSDEDDPLAWVQKSRRKEEDKKQAVEKLKLLEEMDAEFGVSSLVKEEFKTTEPAYSSKNLRGLTVRHTQDRFEEGRTTILTLADKGVLDDDQSDTLVNVNLLDTEVSERSNENKKGKTGYKPWDEPEYDDMGVFKPKEVLDKYNETIHGEKKSSFKLGARGAYNAGRERMMAQIKSDMQNQQQTLDLAMPSLANDYYTSTEMASFKKVKKKIRKIRKKPLKASDLEPLPEPSLTGEDDPSSRPATDWGAAFSTQVGSASKWDTSKVPLDDDDLGPAEDLSGVVLEDDAEADLENTLKAMRRLKESTQPIKREQEQGIKLEDVAALYGKTEEDEEAEEEAREGLMDDNLVFTEGAANMTLNPTDEFCRNLGNLPTYGQSGNREEDDELLEFERELVEQRQKMDEGEENQDKRGWEDVGIDEKRADVFEAQEGAILDDEPMVAHGVGAALMLAQRKGFLDTEVKNVGRAIRNAEEMAAKNYSVDDKRGDDMDDKFRKGRGGRGSGMDRGGPDRFGMGGSGPEFKEKEGYKPRVRLEYTDEHGRMLDQKDAFRHLSWKFHGKTSGKKKTEKRAKKVVEEKAMLFMSATDTPLNTATRLREKLEKEKSACIVLSGGSKTMTSGNLVLK